MVEDKKKKDSELNANHQLVNQLVNAVLVLNGYHTHKGDPCVRHPACNYPVVYCSL